MVNASKVDKRTVQDHQCSIRSTHRSIADKTTAQVKWSRVGKRSTLAKTHTQIRPASDDDDPPPSRTHNARTSGSTRRMHKEGLKIFG